MRTSRLFSVSSFAKLTRTTRDTLHYYDSIGILPAAMRGGNNYRYYSAQQLSSVNLVRVLQELGMTLDEICEVKEKRTPLMMDELFGTQIEKIDKKIGDWVRARKLLLTMRETIHAVLDVDTSAITIQYMPAQAMIMGGLNDYSQGRDEYNALLDFYGVMQEQYPELDLNYPVWAIFSQERVKRGDWQWPDRYYFANPEGLDKKPAALYAIGYMHGGYGQTDELYRRMMRYIRQNGFELCGNVYEEYPLNELSVADSENYLIRVLMTVREAEKDLPPAAP